MFTSARTNLQSQLVKKRNYAAKELLSLFFSWSSCLYTHTEQTHMHDKKKDADDH